MKANVNLAARGRTRRFADPLAAYILIVLFVSLGSVVHSFKTTTIFACPADGYSADVYLAYCGGSHYADYEHGAFAFGLEPSAIDMRGRRTCCSLETAICRLRSLRLRRPAGFQQGRPRIICWASVIVRIWSLRSYSSESTRAGEGLCNQCRRFFRSYPNSSGADDLIRSGSAAAICGQAPMAARPAAALHDLFFALRQRRCHLPFAQDGRFYQTNCQTRSGAGFLR